ncbi:MAG: four helix bundle protein [Treponema sp.]|jgi:hypothetical protein|nr:four helix bundle protein [Treponema sp.]
MALYYDLPVFKDVYSLTLRVFELTQHFSREYKFTLGQDMKRDCLILVRSIYRANKNKDRVSCLEQFLDDFEVLKLEIRLCTDLRLFTINQQAQLALSMETIAACCTCGFFAYSCKKSRSMGMLLEFARYKYSCL